MNIRQAAESAKWYKKQGRTDIVFYKASNGQWMNCRRDHITNLYKRPISRFYEIDEVLEQYGAR